MLQDFLQFVLQNWFLWTLFILLVIAVAWFETRTVVGGVVKIDAQNLVHLINRENATVIDIRDNPAFQEGHIVGSVNLPSGALEDKSKKLQKFKSKAVAVVCGNGQASLKIAQKMKKEGFEKLYVLKGGMTAWKTANLPVEKT